MLCCPNPSPFPRYWFVNMKDIGSWLFDWFVNIYDMPLYDCVTQLISWNDLVLIRVHFLDIRSWMCETLVRDNSTCSWIWIWIWIWNRFVTWCYPDPSPFPRDWLVNMWNIGSWLLDLFVSMNMNIHFLDVSSWICKILVRDYSTYSWIYVTCHFLTALLNSFREMILSWSDSIS